MSDTVAHSATHYLADAGLRDRIVGVRIIIREVRP
jgi:hypothetical protein